MGSVGAVTGPVLLQGGAEFSPRCAAMDATFLAATSGPIVVTALAGAPGREYAAGTQHGVRHLASLLAEAGPGAGARTVTALPDARTGAAALADARALVRDAGVVVLPGGSPARLLETLRATGFDVLLADVLARGGGVLGASAGAMVLGSWTVLPDRPGRPVVAALGLAGDVGVLPHWSGPQDRTDWRDALAAHASYVLGLPEESGLLQADGVWRALGTWPSGVHDPDGSVSLVAVGDSARVAQEEDR